MDGESFEEKMGAHVQPEGAYERYQKLGGIINEQDCKSALARADKATAFNEHFITQAESMARLAGIVLDNSGGIDSRVKLYATLRADKKPKGVEYYHSQMSDPRLFAEVLRILGDKDALSRLIDAYHKAGIYCPICSKVIAPGEKCR